MESSRRNLIIFVILLLSCSLCGVVYYMMDDTAPHTPPPSGFWSASQKLNYDQSAAYCAKHGSVLPTLDQLKKANTDGGPYAHTCAYGWLKEGITGFNNTSHDPGCGGHPGTFTGKADKSAPQSTVYCYGPGPGGSTKVDTNV